MTRLPPIGVPVGDRVLGPMVDSLWTAVGYRVSVDAESLPLGVTDVHVH